MFALKLTKCHNLILLTFLTSFCKRKTVRKKHLMKIHHQKQRNKMMIFVSLSSHLITKDTLPETYSSHQKIDRTSKGNSSEPVIFRGICRFREGRRSPEPRKKKALLSMKSWLFKNGLLIMVYYDNQHITG